MNDPRSTASLLVIIYIYNIYNIIYVLYIIYIIDILYNRYTLTPLPSFLTPFFLLPLLSPSPFPLKKKKAPHLQNENCRSTLDEILQKIMQNNVPPPGISQKIHFGDAVIMLKFVFFVIIIVIFALLVSLFFPFFLFFKFSSFFLFFFFFYSFPEIKRQETSHP